MADGAASTAGFLQRLAVALNYEPVEMAILLGIKRREYEDIAHLPLARLGDSAANPMWAALETEVENRAAALFAARRMLADKAWTEHIARTRRRARMIG